MKVKIMTSDAITFVKENIDRLVSHYENGDDPEIWIKAAINRPAFVEVQGLEFDDFQLLISEDAPSSTDVANIKLLYSKMSDLNDSFASDERLWAGLAHTVFYEYMQKRWPGQTNKDAILNHYFFKGGRPRCYMVQSIARLWWIGHKTISGGDSRVLDYISHDINGYGFTLFGSNWSNSERTLRLFFDAIYDFDKETGGTVGRELFNDAMKYTNALCGIYMLDACDDEFVKSKILEYLRTRSKERKAEAEYNKVNNIKETGVVKFDNIIKALNKLGGHGKLVDILKAYSEVTQETVSPAVKSYVINSLNSNCPDVSDYNGKPFFFKVAEEGGGSIWKIANEYLTRDNMPNRKAFMDQQIHSLSGDEKLVFNLVTAITANRFTLEDILQYKQQIADAFPEIENITGVLKTGVKSLRQKGMLELIDPETMTFKKSYNIKIN